MAKKEVPMGQLQDYLPEGTYEPVLNYLREHKVHLTVARERKSILGDYRHRTGSVNHRISVNGNLNKFSFLITLLHELAHLVTFERFGNRIMAHGKEWKGVYGQLLKQFIENKMFPKDIEAELLQSLHNPGASSCSEEGLLRVLKGYDEKKSGQQFVEQLAIGSLFKTADGRVFQKGEKLRKRFRCVEIATRKIYLFSPVFEVTKVDRS
jgi:SprT protein